MRLRYTRRATRQLEKVLADLAAKSPQGAVNVAARISVVTNLLLQFPFIGRQTTRHRVRRFTVSPYPYVVDYRLDGKDLVILGIRHTSRRPIP